MVVINRRVETNLIVKLNEPFSVVGDSVVFKIPVEVELAILSIKDFVDSPLPVNKQKRHLELTFRLHIPKFLRFRFWFLLC